jgi:hypothetical protein
VREQQVGHSRASINLGQSKISKLYVPNLQTSGQLCAFLEDHLGNRIASPAAIRPMHDRFVQDVAAFANRHVVPIVQRKGSLMCPLAMERGST